MDLTTLIGHILDGLVILACAWVAVSIVAGFGAVFRRQVDQALYVLYAVIVNLHIRARARGYAPFWIKHVQELRSLNPENIEYSAVVLAQEAVEDLGDERSARESVGEAVGKLISLQFSRLDTPTERRRFLDRLRGLW